MGEFCGKGSEWVHELPIGIMIIKGGNELAVEFVNNEFLRMTGYELAQEEAVPDKIQDYIYSEDIGIFEDAIYYCKNHKKSDEFEARVKTKNQQLQWKVFQCKLYYYRNAVPYYILTNRDTGGYSELEDELKVVSERKHLLEEITEERKIRKMLFEEMQLEPLTRLYNKVAAREKIEDFLAENACGTHVLFVIDIDNFKRVNDTFGHTVGDAVISDMAALIREQFRNTDIVGRVGGDEFIVFMKNTTIEDAQIKAKQLCKNVPKKLTGDGAEMLVTLSVGVAVKGIDGDDYATLFEKADMAMYQIKNNGKNDYFFAQNNSEYFYQKKIKEEPEVSRSSSIDKEFLNFAFSLLSHAKDLNASLNVLLERIGRRFHLNMVAVMEYDEEHPSMLVTNCWSDIGQIYEKNVLPITWEEASTVAIGAFTKLDGKQEGKFDLENWNNLRTPIRSMAMVQFEFSNKRVGAMDIGSIEEDMEWSTEDMETICELSRVVGVFVSLRNKIRDDQRTIHKLRNRDKLTGLYNIEVFREKVAEIVKNKEPDTVYALVQADINNFSYVNENFGPVIGDRILNELANLITRRSKDSICSCRMYSDYFVTLIKGKSKDEMIARVAEGNMLFQKEVKEKYPAGSINLSTGICFVEEDITFDNLLEGANLARKYAKEHKNPSGIVYEETMRQKRDEQMEISARFYGAIQKKEFEVYLQPKFLLKERKIYGAEALARWKVPDGRIITPDKFIQALESMGYIVDLDFYIFEQLLRTMKRWQDAGKQLFTISTNFSRKNFENGGKEFLERLSTIMEKYEIDSKYIEIEVTESVVVDNFTNLRHCLGKLREMGFRLAIDDFGTGYSSLNVLFEIPTNIIKIDKSFTDKINMNKQRDFISKMGQFIKAAKEEVIFEGIETEEQADFLKSCGFLYGQGYLFDKPIPVSEFERKYL